MTVGVLSSSGMASLARSNLTRANSTSVSSISKLSSGNRITNAADDVAGMSVGTGLRSSVRGIQAGLQNVAQGTSMLQIADGGLSQISEILQRQKQLAVMASSGAMTDSERGFLDTEFQNLRKEIDRIANETSFNGVPLLSGTGLSLRNNATITNSVLPYNPDGTNALGNALGELRWVDEGGNALGQEEVAALPEKIAGQVTDIKYTNVKFGVAANVTAKINGHTYTGIVAHNGTTSTVTDGTNYIELGLGTVDLTNGATTAVSQNIANNAFSNMFITRRTTANFEHHVSSSTFPNNAFIERVRVHSYMPGSQPKIDNVRYLGNDGAVGTSRLALDLNGRTLVATSVPDDIAGATNLYFDAEGTTIDRVWIRVTGITDVNGDNIRLDEGFRDQVISALNRQLALAGDGYNMGIGSATSTDINVDIGAVTTSVLYEGNAVGLKDPSSANITSIQLNKAIDYVTSVRADVGAQQSRLNFASSNMTVALQNQDAARGVYQDTDIAHESTRYATSQTQMQAAISVLAQANAAQSNMLELLG